MIGQSLSMFNNRAKASIYQALQALDYRYSLLHDFTGYIFDEMT